MNWKTTIFGEVVKLEQGLAFNKNNNYLIVDDGIPLLRITDLIYNTESKFVDRNKVPLKFLSKPTDIIFTRTGQVGLVFKGRVGIVHNNCFRIIPFECIDPNFVFWYLKQPSVIEHAQNLAGGSAQPDLCHDAFKSLPFRYPPLPTQQKIAAILSTYDDLIENNTRRIKILEEMAQAIYREWFVNFRFPGHENVRMVESELGLVPEGWEVKRLDEVAEVIDCLHGIKPTEVINDDEKFGILLHVWNIGEEGKLELSKKFFITEEVYRLWTRRIEVKEGDCVITNVGRIGAVAQIPFDLKAAIGRNMTAIRCREGIITPTYLIEYLRSPYFEREKNLKQDSGTVMGSLNVKGIVRLNIPIPSFNLVKEFETAVRPFRYRIEIFQIQNANLRRTRDLLLPKLISGELDVSGLDIRIPEAEA